MSRKTFPPKPKTVHDALEFWAKVVVKRKTDDTYSPWFDVNSIVMQGDTIFHYGLHYPMAKIARNADGKVTAIYVNSTRWGGASGFGFSTDSLVYTLTEHLRKYAPAGVPVHRIPLSGSTVLVESDPRNPEPVVPALDIPVCPRSYTPVDPGPEPVWQDTPDCKVGHEEEYSFQAKGTHYSFSGPMPTGAFVRSVDQYGTHYTVEKNGVIIYGRSSWGGYGDRRENVTYKQCPHCAAHDRRADRWRSMMNDYGSSRIGWRTYSATLEKFGTIEAWREARRALMAERKVKRAEHDAWLAKNTLSLSDVPVKRFPNRVNVPMVNPETGRVKRTTAAKIKRDARRREREVREEQARKAAA